MAFMMPVMKNDWDIYKSNRSRKSSEGSGSQSSRSRKISETKSESGGVYSPSGGSLGSPAHRSVPTMMSATRATRPPRPARSLSCSPPNPTPSPEKFHTRLMDKLKRTLIRKDRESTEEKSS